MMSPNILTGPPLQRSCYRYLCCDFVLHAGLDTRPYTSHLLVDLLTSEYWSSCIFLSSMYASIQNIYIIRVSQKVMCII